MELTLQEMLAKAATVAAKAHDGQKRKDGSPYFAHPVRVMLRCDDTRTRIAALLHDVVEDTSVSLDDLHEMGFSYEILEIVDALTKRAGEKYPDFITRCLSNPYAVRVKIADIEDNLGDQSALDPDEAAFLQKRYGAALERLQEAL